MADLLWILAAALLVVWLLGVGGVFSMGGITHLFLVLAIATIVVNLMYGHRTVT